MSNSSVVHSIHRRWQELSSSSSSHQSSTTGVCFPVPCFLYPPLLTSANFIDIVMMMGCHTSSLMQFDKIFFTVGFFFQPRLWLCECSRCSKTCPVWTPRRMSTWMLWKPSSTSLFSSIWSTLSFYWIVCAGKSGLLGAARMVFTDHVTSRGDIAYLCLRAGHVTQATVFNIFIYLFLSCDQQYQTAQTTVKTRCVGCSGRWLVFLHRLMLRSTWVTKL